MSKEIKYTDVVPNSIVTRYKEDNIQYLLDQVARLTAENAMLKEKWSTPKQPEQKQEPVGIVRTIGGYPDDSEHIVEWLCKYKDLKEGDRLYLAPQTHKPITGKEISNGFKDDDDATHPYSYWAGINFAEKHHGIGEG